MNWLPAHKNCPVIQVSILLPFKTMLGSPNCLPTSPLFVVIYLLFSEPDWCHLITLLFDFPLLPADTPSTLSHAPQLPAAVICPFSDPSSSSLLVLHNPFPTKTYSNAKMNCPALAFTSILHNLLLWLVMLRHPPAWFRAGETAHSVASPSATSVSHSSFHPGIVQGSICKQRCHS